ncbi:MULTISPECIES: hypothetical protein [Streptomyces]|uniref:Uncharacterized protein n=1 Tax=Streptomyces siderophoricus TaxID=2802281 RepID=A0ABS1N078_9ACTN|nr:hypothetical protein [Streptomyces sp. 9-7]MBL1093456.1 hypothetical protein [Streptomyces sp. 9-7]
MHVDSLQGWSSADITVHGPADLSSHITRSKVFTNVQPGTYTITAKPKRGSQQDLYPPNQRQTVTVREGHTATVTVEYANVIPHTTKVLDAQHLGVVGGVQRSELTFEQGAPAAASLRAGDVITAGLGPKTPYGLLRKVTAVHHAPGGLIRVSTQKATLHDAVPQGQIDVRGKALLSPGQVRNSGSLTSEPAFYRPMSGSAAEYRATEAVDPSGGADTFETGGDGTFSIMHTVREHKFTKDQYGPAKDEHGVAKKECGWGTTSPLLAQTMFKAQKPKIDFGAVWNNTQLNSVRWSLTTQERAGLRAATESVEGKCEWKWTYPEPATPVGEVVVEVGPVPLVFVVEANMVGAFGVGGKVSFDVTQKAQLTAGLQYKAGHATGIHSFQNSFSLAKPPTAEVETSLKGGVRYTLLLEGMIGPYLDITPGVKLVEKEEFGKNGAAKAELRAGLYTSAGLDLKKLGFEGRAVEIGDLWHKDKALATFPWKGSAHDRAPKKSIDPNKEVPCPADPVIRHAITAAADSGIQVHLADKTCWPGWAVVTWAEQEATDVVTISVFKRTSRLMPVLHLLPVVGDDSNPDWLSDCRKLRSMKPPSGVLAAAGCQVSETFDAEAALRLIRDAGLTADTDGVADLPGPLRAVRATCTGSYDGNCAGVFFFYNNRYVGFASGPGALAIHGDGTTATLSYPVFHDGDANCCPSGGTVRYQVRWSQGGLVSNPALPRLERKDESLGAGGATGRS